ncbi:hypothetical protein AB0N89_01365 [Amycolatopsis sp. NPDC089917]|uniref:hypothetical protein n=1 Tax=Amycolatopsis sp. NPDC089917 TaxID=3155187 RepID=UPI0034439560
MLIVAAVALVCAIAAITFVVTGFPQSLFGGGKYAIPPCEQLPSRAAVTQAIARNAKLTDQLTRAGSGVRIDAGSPCSGQDKSIVTVHVTSDAEENAVNDILGKSEGFGVPATIEKS